MCEHPCANFFTNHTDPLFSQSTQTKFSRALKPALLGNTPLAHIQVRQAHAGKLQQTVIPS